MEKNTHSSFIKSPITPNHLQLNTNTIYSSSKISIYSYDLLEYEIKQYIDKPFIDSSLSNILVNWSKETCITFCKSIIISPFKIILDINDFNNLCPEGKIRSFLEKYIFNGGLSKYFLLSIIFFLIENDVQKVLSKTLTNFCFEEEGKMRKVEFEYFLFIFFQSIITFVIEKRHINCCVKEEDINFISNDVFNCYFLKRKEEENEVKIDSGKDMLSIRKHKEKSICVDNENEFITISDIVDSIRGVDRIWSFFKLINFRCYEDFKEVEDKAMKK